MEMTNSDTGFSARLDKVDVPCELAIQYPDAPKLKTRVSQAIQKTKNRAHHDAGHRFVARVASCARFTHP